MSQDSKAGQTDNADKRIEDRMKELEKLADKANESIKVLQNEVADRQRRISQLRDELIRMQGAYAELRSQKSSNGDKKKEEK